MVGRSPLRITLKTSLEGARMNDLRILTQEQVAEALGVSVMTVVRLRKNPEAQFPGRRIMGKTRGWLYSEIHEWLLSRPTED